MRAQETGEGRYPFAAASGRRRLWNMRRRRDGVCALLFLCLIVMVSAGCARGIDTSKFEGVYHAAKAVEAYTREGARKDEFGRLLKKLVLELGLTERTVRTEKEERLYHLYEQAVLVYDESYGFWDTGYREFNPDEQEGLALVARRYDVPTEPVKERDIIAQYENNLRWMKSDMMGAKSLMEEDRRRGTDADSPAFQEKKRDYEQKLKEYHDHRERRADYIAARKRNVRMDGDRAKERMWLHAAALLQSAFRFQDTHREE